MAMLRETFPPLTVDEGLQAGFTVVEMMIVTVLTALILGVFYGSAASVSTVASQNNLEVRSRAKQSDILARVRKELEQSGNDGRYTILSGGKSIVYTKLIGAQQTGADVSGLWSQTFCIELTSRGEVARKEGSNIVFWGSGVNDLTFAQTLGDPYITVTCVTTQNGADVARSINIYPRN